MAYNTKIQWATHTFNPWRGCEKVSPGCDNCYAEEMSDRNPAVLGEWGPQGTRVIASEAMWKEPLKWDRASALAKAMAEAADKPGDFLSDISVLPYQRPRVFCASLGDVLEDYVGHPVNSRGERLSLIGDDLWIPDGMLAADDPRIPIKGLSVPRRRLYTTINATQNLDWLLLTKRPENARSMLPDRWMDIRWPENVWMGTSIENQDAADIRIPKLLNVPARIRFLSVEPLLGPIDISEWLYTIRVEHNGDGDTQEVPCRPPIHWVIIGGESGRYARELYVEWVVDLVNQCKEAEVPVFVKQLGRRPTFKDTASGLRIRLPLTHPKGGDMEEWPESLQLQEFPK